MNPEYVVARDVTGQAFLWCAMCAKSRYVCIRWKLTPEDERRINFGIVDVEALTDQNPAHGNFADVAGAFAFFADVPDKSLASSRQRTARPHRNRSQRTAVRNRLTRILGSGDVRYAFSLTSEARA